MTGLEARLRALREGGRKALVPYVVGGLSEDWTRYVEAAFHAGADLVEVGIPFSDPMMDGPVIQEGSLRALARGVTVTSICEDLAAARPSGPVVAMTYFNLLHHDGLERVAGRLAGAGFLGTIVPDLALEEAGEWREASAKEDLATIFLVAPSTPSARVRRVADASQGFVYASARMAVTGEAADLGAAPRVVEQVRAVSDLPVYVGIGITTPDQAAEAALVADGVIVGSALVRLLLEGATPESFEEAVATFRTALDTPSPQPA